jgi:hypothetical protein
LRRSHTDFIKVGKADIGIPDDLEDRVEGKVPAKKTN